MDWGGDDPGSPAAAFCPSQPRGGGLPRRRLGVQVLCVLLCFHCWQTATLCCGSVGDLYGFSCTRGYKPCRKLLYLSRCLPWELPGAVPPPVLLTANLSQVIITAPRQRLEWSLWHLQNPWFLPWLIVKSTYTHRACPAAHSLQLIFLLSFFSPFWLDFCWGKLPILGVRRNAENGVKGAKISQGRFFRADPPLGPISVRRACRTQLHHAVRQRDLKSNPHMQLFLLLPWIENPWQGRRVNPSLGGRLWQPCRHPVLQQGAESSIRNGSDCCKTWMYFIQMFVSMLYSGIRIRNDSSSKEMQIERRPWKILVLCPGCVWDREAAGPLMEATWGKS